MIKKLVTLAALAMLLGSPTSYAVFVLGNTLVEKIFLSTSKWHRVGRTDGESR